MIVDMILRKSPAGFRAIVRGIQPNGAERILFDGEGRASVQEAQADLTAYVQGLNRGKRTEPDEDSGAE